VREVAHELGYDDAFITIDETTERLDAIVQSGQTDARFLAHLAARHGFVFHADEEGLVWRRARRDERPSHVLVYYDTQRGDILDVNVESDLGRRVGNVAVRGRDPRTRTTIEASATSDSVARTTLGEVVEVVDPETGASALETRTATSSVRSTTAETADAAQTEADSRYRAAEERAVRLTVRAVGDPTLTSGRIVEVRNISRLLFGNYFVRTATHAVAGDGYTTELALRRDGVGRTARQLARPQGGTPNEQQADTSDDESPASRMVETVDPESGRSQIEYRSAEATR
jgi:phage protein D